VQARRLDRQGGRGVVRRRRVLVSESQLPHKIVNLVFAVTKLKIFGGVVFLKLINKQILTDKLGGKGVGAPMERSASSGAEEAEVGRSREHWQKMIKVHPAAQILGYDPTCGIPGPRPLNPQPRTP